MAVNGEAGLPAPDETRHCAAQVRRTGSYRASRKYRAIRTAGLRRKVIEPLVLAKPGHRKPGAPRSTTDSDRRRDRHRLGSAASDSSGSPPGTGSGRSSFRSASAVATLSQPGVLPAGRSIARRIASRGVVACARPGLPTRRASQNLCQPLRFPRPRLSWCITSTAPRGVCTVTTSERLRSALPAGTSWFGLGECHGFQLFRVRLRISPADSDACAVGVRTSASGGQAAALAVDAGVAPISVMSVRAVMTAASMLRDESGDLLRPHRRCARRRRPPGRPARAGARPPRSPRA